jgi:uncharacterized protein Smg (DUF494 family)
MFDVLVYLYETYYRPDACPDSAALAKKLSAVGFEADEISKALGWLTDLAETTHELSDQYPQQTAFSFGTRIYVLQELEALGTAAVGFIQFLESAKVINPIQREIVVERAGGLRRSYFARQTEGYRADGAVEPGPGTGRTHVRRTVSGRRRDRTTDVALGISPTDSSLFPDILPADTLSRAGVLQAAIGGSLACGFRGNPLIMGRLTPVVVDEPAFSSI